MSDDAERAPDEKSPESTSAEQTLELAQDESPEILPERQPFRSALHGLSLIEQGIGVFLLFVILVLVLVQVGQRYTPGTGLPATGEIARLSMVWLTFVLSGYLMAHDRHISIRVIDYVLPRRMVGAVETFGHMFVAAACAALAYAVYDLIASDRGQVTPAAQLPLTIVYAVALYGLASTALRAVVAVVVNDIPAMRDRGGQKR